MKYTEEQKREFALEAMQNFREAQKMAEAGKKLMKRCGVEFGCSIDVIDKYYHAEWQDTDGGMMIHKGLRKLAKLFDADTFTPLNWNDKPDKSRIACKVGGLYFYQLGDSTKTNYKFS